MYLLIVAEWLYLDDRGKTIERQIAQGSRAAAVVQQVLGELGA